MNSKRLWMNGRGSFVAMVWGYVLPSRQISHVCLLYWKTVKMTCDKCEKQVSKHVSTAAWAIQTRTWVFAEISWGAKKQVWQMNSKRLWMNGRRRLVAMVRGYVLPSMQISRACLLLENRQDDLRQMRKTSLEACFNSNLRNTDKDLQFLPRFLEAQKTSVDRWTAKGCGWMGGEDLWRWCGVMSCHRCRFHAFADYTGKPRRWLATNAKNKSRSMFPDTCQQCRQWSWFWTELFPSAERYVDGWAAQGSWGLVCQDLLPWACWWWLSALSFNFACSSTGAVCLAQMWPERHLFVVSPAGLLRGFTEATVATSFPPGTGRAKLCSASSMVKAAPESQTSTAASVQPPVVND